MLMEITDRLVKALAPLTFCEPVSHVYNPMAYARQLYDQYLERWGGKPREVVFLGMNPGPWGMAQTGIPFGSVPPVKHWLKLEGEVGRPAQEHPKRPIQGLGCPRVEVSGKRLWGWAQARFVTPARFFSRFFVLNYCPLVFMAESGRNITPDKLRRVERDAVEASCDLALLESIEALEPEWVIGVGKYAEDRAKRCLGALDVKIGRVLHPSPASPAANRGWREQAERQLLALGVLTEEMIESDSAVVQSTEGESK